MVGTRGGEILARLKANAKQRQRAQVQLEATREELAELLAAGREAGFSVSDMAAFAQVSRETAHKALRERERKQ